VRGFITFVLAAAFVLVVFSIRSTAEQEGVAAQVQKLEKKYYFEMDAKHALRESVRRGAREAEIGFAKCAASGNCEKSLREMVEEGVGARIAALAVHLEGNGRWEAQMWCGRTSEEELGEIAQAGNPGKTLCAQCKSAKDGCGKFVDVDVVRKTVRLQKAEVLLGVGEISVVGFGALEREGEISFESYFPPWIEIGY